MKVDLFFSSDIHRGIRHSVKTIVIALSCLLPVCIFGQDPIGSEFRVNTHTLDDQINPSVAMDAAGNFVCVWNSEYQDGDGYGVYAQRYDQNGDTLGPEFRVNLDATSWQFGSDVAVAPDGSFVITWDGTLVDINDVDVYYRRFDAMGNPLSGDVLVNTYVADNQRTSAIAMDEDGNFVIVWESEGQDGSGYGIFGQRFNTNGTKIGGEFQVNTYSTNWQTGASVDMAPDGRFVVGWHSLEQDGDWWGVYAQRFDANGNKVGAEFRVNSTTSGGQNLPNVALDGSGNYMICWESDNQDGSVTGVYVRKYSANGDTLSGELRVNTYTFSEQSTSSIDADSVGNFVVAWQSPQDGDGFGIVARVFNSDCDTVGAEFVVNTNPNNAQQDPDIMINDNGDFIVLWESFLQDGSDNGIYGQRFYVDFVNDNDCGSTDPLILTGTVNMDTTYSTSQYIETDQMLLPGVMVNYEAGQTVELLAGFEIQSGAIFNVEIVDCGGN